MSKIFLSTEIQHFIKSNFSIVLMSKSYLKTLAGVWRLKYLVSVSEGNHLNYIMVQMRVFFWGISSTITFAKHFGLEKISRVKFWTPGCFKWCFGLIFSLWSLVDRLLGYGLTLSICQCWHNLINIQQLFDEALGEKKTAISVLMT